MWGRQSCSNNYKSIIKLFRSGGKTRGVKKISVSDDYYVGKLRK